MEPFIGQIQPFGFNFPPRGWTLCDGQLLPISQNTALFSLLGTTFGGDGRTTFGLPDLRGRSIVHVGSGPGLSPIKWGQKGGNEQIVLAANQLPAHQHPVAIPVRNGGGDETNPGGGIPASAPAGSDIYSSEASNATFTSFQSSNNSGGQAVNIRNPFLGIYVSIALTGVYPSRS